MFKGFQNTSRTNGFNGFPALNFQMNNEAYGFSGCTFWLDAAYGTNTVTDLAAVSLWTDKIRNIRFEQSTAANQPYYIASHASYNNLPVISSSSGTKYITSRFGLTIDPSNYTFVCIANYDTLQGGNCILGHTTSATQFAIGGSFANWNGVTFYNSPLNQIQVTGTTDSTSVKIAVMTNNNLYVNGSLESTQSITSVDVAFNQIFGGRNGTNILFGNIAELIIFNKSINSSECVQLSNRINSKYAIY